MSIIVDLPNFSYTGIGTILSVQSATVTDVSAPRYTIGGKYWNGSGWVTSNGSYAQANDSATLIANLTALVVTGATSVPMSVVFTDSNTQSSVDLITATLTGQKYASFGYVEPSQAIDVQSISNYSQIVITDADTSVKIIVGVDGILKWWNGTIWTLSDGTAAQANTASEIATNIAALSFGSNSSVIFRWILSSSVISKTPELDQAIITYDFGGLETTPALCLVWGYYKDISGMPIVGATVKFEIVKKNSKEYREANQNVIAGSVSATTDSNGYFEINLIRSSEYEGSIKYKVTFTKDPIETSLVKSKALEFDVPDADNKDLSDLLIAS